MRVSTTALALGLAVLPSLGLIGYQVHAIPDLLRRSETTAYEIGCQMRGERLATCRSEAHAYMAAR